MFKRIFVCVSIAYDLFIPICLYFCLSIYSIIHPSVYLCIISYSYLFFSLCMIPLSSHYPSSNFYRQIKNCQKKRKRNLFTLQMDDIAESCPFTIFCNSFSISRRLLLSPIIIKIKTINKYIKY